MTETHTTIELMELHTGERLLIEYGRKGIIVQALDEHRQVLRCIEIGGDLEAVVIPLDEAVVDRLAADLREALDDGCTVRVRPLFERE